MEHPITDFYLGFFVCLFVLFCFEWFSLSSKFTCTDAIEESSHHNHLKGHCCLAQDHQHSSKYSHKIV